MHGRDDEIRWLAEWPRAKAHWMRADFSFMIGFIPPVVAALLGALVGTFLNTCIDRFAHSGAIASPASVCQGCGRRLSRLEKLPVVAYVALGGRCRTCDVAIPPRYAIVEALTATTFALGWWYYGPGPLLASRLLLGCALILLFVVDLEDHRLPNAITLPGIVVGFAFSFFAGPGWSASLGGIVLGAAVLLLVAEISRRLRREEGLGMGDVKMLAMIGAFVGWKLMLVALVMALFSGSAIGLALIVTGRTGRQHMLPFGTFLAFGAAIAVTVGPTLVDWYVALW